MYIDAMPYVLRWQDFEETCSTIHDAYEKHLSIELARTLVEAKAAGITGKKSIPERIRNLPDSNLIRWLMAPTVSYRLLWTENQIVQSRYAYLETALLAEECLAGIASPSATIWAALGDYRIDSDGTARPSPEVVGLPPLDFDSPHALHLDLDGELEKLEPRREPMDECEKQTTLMRLSDAVTGIYATNSRYLDFIHRFTKVLVIQRDEKLQNFTSGTSGQFVGRSVLANTHLPTTSTEMIAEGIVHESIHGLLYMQEQVRPWVDSRDLYGSTIRTVSPWTRTSLPLRPYIQAAFVWYGLFHFWALANNAGVFDSDRRRTRLVAAARGFLADPLVDQLASWKDGIDPDLLTAMDAMQDDVNRAVKSIVPNRT